ncbi:transposase [Litoribacter populi]|uniref:transposase n=1 Tax=Litoribacter populi TaxID=2598460 RepID=UPI00117BF332|nr:transposase [Litoribacter populi]
MAKSERKVVRYGIGFKKMVVSELEEGASVGFLQKKYGIGGAATIQGWAKRFGKYQLLNKIVRIENMSDQNRLKKLEEELKATKIALADSLIAKQCLEALIEEANKEYKTDLKKNFGSDASAKKGEN